MNARNAILLFAALVWTQLVIAVCVLFWGFPFIAVFIAVFALACGVFFVSTAYSVLFGAPFVPMDAEHVEEMIRLAEIKPDERLVDLGSGDGRILIAAAKAGALSEGWEISPYLWLISLWNIRRAGMADRATAHLGSYWAEKFDAADVVTLFLITPQMPRMEKKLRRELRLGSRVASYAFTFPEWKHAAKSPGGVYLYRQE